MTWLSSQKDRYLKQLTRELFRLAGVRWPRRRTLGLTAATFLVIMSLALSFSGIGTFGEVSADNSPLTMAEISMIPGDIIEDATRIAEDLYGRSQEAISYTNQLLAAYAGSINQDVLILFNSGGWGITSLEKTADWASILQGLESELGNSGYRVAAFNYQRTMKSVSSRLNEFKEICTGYLDKAEDLASRIEFLIKYNPDLKIILAGESTGTAICDSTMNILKDNHNVYSIQTGVPFWQQNTIRNRTLVLNDNGIERDAFSHGDVWTILSTSFRSLWGAEELDNGTILGFLSSPGHEYWWQEPGVYNAIEKFLSTHFGVQPKVAY